MDIKQLLSDQVQTKVKSAAIEKFGLSESTADTAIDGAITAILGGLKHNVASDTCAAALDTALEKDHDGSVLSDVDGALKSGTLQQEGSKILEHIFGAKTDTVAESVGVTAGTNKPTAISILSTVAPLVLGQLGKTKQAGGLDATGIADTLLRQQLPKNGIVDTLSSLLDHDKDGQILDDVINLGNNFFKKK